MTVELMFDGDKNSSLFTALREYDPRFEDGAAVCLYALSEESLGTLIDPSAVDAAAMAGVFKRRRRHNVLSCRNGRRSVFNREHIRRSRFIGR